jgi:hypothetical protein
MSAFKKHVYDQINRVNYSRMLRPEKENNKYINTLTNDSDQVLSPHHENLFLFKEVMVNMQQDEILTLDKHIPTH